MEGFRLELVTRRERRAAALVLAALAVLAAAGVQFLRPHEPAPAAGAAGPPAPQRPDLASFQLEEEGAGWVALSKDGAAGAVALFATRDGGGTWHRVPMPPRDRFFLGMRFFDGRTGLLQLGGPGRQLNWTADGGAHWRATDVPPGSQMRSAATFLDPERGWYLEQQAAISTTAGHAVRLYRTVDGGGTWAELLGVDPGSGGGGGLPEAGVKELLGFRDDLVGWIAVRDGGAVPRLYATRDGGLTWSPEDLAPPPGGWPAGAVPRLYPPRLFGDEGELSLVLQGPASRALAYRTRDGGLHWEGPVELPVAGPNPPLALDGRRWWLPDGQRIWTSDDAGATWRSQLPGLPVDGRLGALQVSGRTAWASASRGGLLGSGDGGLHWEFLRLPALGGP
jgi:photosystem II stability/assembly factor-like uncharacterized protein